MGHTPIQTVSSTAAQPFLFTLDINHSFSATLFCVRLHRRFYHRIAISDAYGQLLHNALLFGHSKGDLNPIPPTHHRSACFPPTPYC